MEPGVPTIGESIDTLLELEKIVGAKRIAWRYDPVLLTKEYTIARHFKTFSAMAQRLSGHIDRCIFSFVEMYRKLQFNMPELIPFRMEDMEVLAQGLGAIAAKYHVPIQICGTNEDFRRYGIRPAGCMTLDILGQANGIAFRPLKHKGMRQGCHCIESRDIGAYDTCPNGCKYCYANTNPRKAWDNLKRHDPASPLLLGQIEKTDVLQQGSQKSFLKGR